MIPKNVKVMRVFNLGNYESARIEWEVEIEPHVYLEKTEVETLVRVTDSLWDDLTAYGKSKGWVK